MSTHVIPNRGRSDADYLLTRRRIVGECWLWTGPTSEFGYGSTTPTRPGSRVAHRLSYLTFVGPIPDGMQIDHLCRTPACFNPEHLEAVTPRINTLRGIGPSAANAQKDTCPQGHAYEGDNVRVDPKTSKRYCRTCQRQRAQQRRQAQGVKPRRFKNPRAA
jgi:hypothetical protein